MREHELKLSVEDPFSAPALRPDGVEIAGIEELPKLDLRATYYDTSDLRLARNGSTLRYRTGEEGGRSGWSLKLPVPGDDGSTREELPFEGAEGSVPVPARELVTAFSRGEELAPVAHLHTQRRRWCLRSPEGEEIAELVDDRVSVMKLGRVVERFRELELESRGLEQPALERIARTLQEAGASAPRPVPKLVRALGAKATLPPDVAEPPSRIPPTDPAAYAVQAAIARGVRRIIMNDPGSRLGEVEPVHQMRVGARRLRSDLSTFAPLLLQEWAEELRSELRWLGDALGEVRDVQVMKEQLTIEVAGLDGALAPLFEQLEEQHLVARAGLLNVLRGERYLRLLEKLVAAAQNPQLAHSAWRPSGEALPPIVRGPWKKLRKAARSLEPDDPDDSFHRVRIRAKRARYAAEALAPALGDAGPKARSFASGASDVQEVLGTLQDAVMVKELVSQAVAARAADAEFDIAAGRLLEREELRSREARAAFWQAWHSLDQPKRRKWMKQ